MPATTTARALRRAIRNAGARPVSVFAVVDGERIPPSCYGEPMCIASAERRWARAYDALCRSLCDNGQVGITAVEVDGEPCVAALLSIGGVLAVSPLSPDVAVFGLSSPTCTRRGRPRRRRKAN
jgi:hypothetical protein